jgi:energy-converting hydrogenase A subunit M
MLFRRKNDNEIGQYTIQKLSYFRRIFIDSLDVLTPIHNMLALLEFDITDARKKIREEIRKGRRISLQAFIIKSIASAVSESKELNSILSKNRLVIFDDIDINIPLELNIEGDKFPRQIIIRKASEKSIEEIFNEIEEAKKQFFQHNVTGNEDKWAMGLMKILFIFPRFLRKFLIRIMVNDPFLVKKKSGTIHFTSVAGFVQSPGFAIPCAGNFRAVDFTLGSIVNKPAKVSNEILLREILSITVMFNHDIVDGAPAARFTNRLKRIIENAEVL